MNMRERLEKVLESTATMRVVAGIGAIIENPSEVIDALLDALTANPGVAITAAGREHMMENLDEGIGETFCAMIRAIKDGK